MKISLLLIGDEILNGSREDLNAHFIIKKISKKNRVLSNILIVGDNDKKIIEGIQFLLQVSDFIITSGGLGLTPDDITLRTIAKGLKRKVIKSDKARNFVEKSLNKLNKQIKENLIENFSVCIEGAEIMENKAGVAPIEKIRIRNKVLFILPGVPEEFSRAFFNYVLPEIAEGKSSKEIALSVNCSESDIVDLLDRLEKEFSVKTASYPPISRNRFLLIKIKGKNTDNAQEFFIKNLKERSIKFEKNFSR